MNLWRALTILLIVALNVCCFFGWAIVWAFVSMFLTGIDQCCGPAPSMWENTLQVIAFLLPPAMICYFLNMSIIRRAYEYPSNQHDDPESA